MNAFDNRLSDDNSQAYCANSLDEVSSPEPLENDLRTLFAGQATEPIATDAAWARVSPRLAQMGAIPKDVNVTPVSGDMLAQAEGIQTMRNTTINDQSDEQAAAPVAPVALPGNALDRRNSSPNGKQWGWRRMAVTAVAAVVVAAALMGAGFGAASYFDWLHNSKLDQVGAQHLYTTLNQAQTDQGVRVALDWAYADPGDFYLSYHSMGVTEATRNSTYFFWMTFDLRDQFGEINQVGYTSCQEGPGNGGAQYCLMDIGALSLPAKVTSLKLTLDISTIMLAKAGSSNTITLHGDWHFSFNLPYHPHNITGGGFPQILPTPTR